MYRQGKDQLVKARHFSSPKSMAQKDTVEKSLINLWERPVMVRTMVPRIKSMFFAIKSPKNIYFLQHIHSSVLTEHKADDILQMKNP